MARIQFRRGTAAFWESENPILHPGEPGFEKNTKWYKIGDGVTPWNDLPYIGLKGDPGEPGPPGPDAEAAIEDHVNDSTPHPVYDDAPSLLLLYQNAKV